MIVRSASRMTDTLTPWNTNRTTSSVSHTAMTIASPTPISAASISRATACTWSPMRTNSEHRTGEDGDAEHHRDL